MPCTRYVDLGKPRDGNASSTIRALAKTLYGTSLGGANRAQVTKAMINLFRMEAQMAGVRGGAASSIGSFSASNDCS